MKNKIYIFTILTLTTVNIFTVFLLINNNRFDVNNDGFVNSQDLLELQKHLIEGEK